MRSWTSRKRRQRSWLRNSRSSWTPTTRRKRGNPYSRLLLKRDNTSREKKKFKFFIVMLQSLWKFLKFQATLKLCWVCVLCVCEYFKLMPASFVRYGSLCVFRWLCIFPLSFSGCDAKVASRGWRHAADDHDPSPLPHHRPEVPHGATLRGPSGWPLRSRNQKLWPQGTWKSILWS